MGWKISLFAIGLIALLSEMAHGEDSAASEQDAIRNAGKAYVTAFNAGDVQKIASLWSPKAVYTNRLTGEQVVGREGIAEQFQVLFENAKGLKLEVDVASIDLISPNVAMEKGVATFVAPESDPESVDYSAIYIRMDDQWLLDRVTDDPIPVMQSNYEQLKELEWLIGNWVDEDPDAEVVTECSWTKNQNFITRSFMVSVEDIVDLSGMQIIGWDAVNKQIRSWTFDSDGGFATARWTRSGDRWFVQKKANTPDGKIATAVNVLSKVDDDAFTIQSTQRSVGGELLPNIDEVMVVRK